MRLILPVPLKCALLNLVGSMPQINTDIGRPIDMDPVASPRGDLKWIALIAP